MGRENLQSDADLSLQGNLLNHRPDICRITLVRGPPVVTCTVTARSRPASNLLAFALRSMAVCRTTLHRGRLAQGSALGLGASEVLRPGRSDPLLTDTSPRTFPYSEEKARRVRAFSL